jgi:hypothetical protein
MLNNVDPGIEQGRAAVIRKSSRFHPSQMPLIDKLLYKGSLIGAELGGIGG